MLWRIVLILVIGIFVFFEIMYKGLGEVFWSIVITFSVGGLVWWYVESWCKPKD